MSLAREVARREVTLQGREFLTWVYLLVFLCLGLGFTSSGAVELVRDRGDLARNAPWVLAQAMAGMTAFGQVITTMITATAIMRDVATREQELLFTTRLTRRDYLLGRGLGALAIMLVVYLGVPAGLLAGTLMPWVEPATLAVGSASAYLRPFLALVVPNACLVGALFFTAGALGRGFMAILLLGLALVALWGTGVGLVRDGLAIGALVDPFGNAALAWVTRDWDLAQRAAAPMPLGGLLLANRVAWLAVAGLALLVLARRYRMQLVVRDAGGRAATDAAKAPVARRGPAVATTVPTRVAAFRAEAAWIARWTLREKGVRTLLALGAVNALANAWRAGGAGPVARDVLGAVHEHSRVFLILLATIYAGELTWRERDVRADAFADTLPVGSGTLVAARLAGILLAELVVVLPLGVVALGTGVARDVDGLHAGTALAWTLAVSWSFVAQLTLLSLAVHALVQHKVAGHVLLIVAWVVGTAVARTWSLPAALQLAPVPSMAWTASGTWAPLSGDTARLAAHGFATALGCGVVAWLAWVRGSDAGWRARLRMAAERIRATRGLPLLGAAVALAWTTWRTGGG